MERHLRAYAVPAIAYLVLLEAMLAAAILYWPNFEENIGALKAMAPLDMLKDVIDTLAQGGVEAYVSGQHFFKGCNTLGTAAAVLFSAGAIAGEAHRGTFEIWVARPFTRRRLLLERYVAGALAMTVPIVLTTLTIPWLLTFVDEEMELGPLLLCAVHQSAFLLGTYSLTFLLSTLSSNPLSVTLVVLFFTTLEFALYLVKGVTHYSIFRLTDIEDFMAIMSSGSLDWGVVLPLLGVSALLLGASLFVFSRRVP